MSRNPREQLLCLWCLPSPERRPRLILRQAAESLDLEAGFQESLRRARVLDAQERGATGDKRLL